MVYYVDIHVLMEMTMMKFLLPYKKVKLPSHLLNGMKFQMMLKN